MRRKLVKSKPNNGLVAGVVVLGAGLAFSFPFWLQSKQTQNTIDSDKPLSASQIQRGPYMNSGSRDVGPDPDWNRKTNAWEGRRAEYEDQYRRE